MGADKTGPRIVESGLKEAAGMATIYDEVYRRALSDPERFWAVAAEDIALRAAGVTEHQIEVRQEA